MTKVQALSSMIYGYVSIKGVVSTKEVLQHFGSNMFLSVTDTNIASAVSNLINEGKIVRISLYDKETGEHQYFFTEPKKEYYIEY